MDSATVTEEEMREATKDGTRTLAAAPGLPGDLD